jgi:hypothetical protein
VRWLYDTVVEKVNSNLKRLLTHLSMTRNPFGMPTPLSAGEHSGLLHSPR